MDKIRRCSQCYEEFEGTGPRIDSTPPRGDNYKDNIRFCDMDCLYEYINWEAMDKIEDAKLKRKMK